MGIQLIKIALSEWQGDSESSIQHAIDMTYNVRKQDPVAVDALIRISTFERQFAQFLHQIGVCYLQHSANRMLALAAAIAEADLRLCEPEKFSLDPFIITETLVSLHLDRAPTRQ